LEAVENMFIGCDAVCSCLIRRSLCFVPKHYNSIDEANRIERAKHQ
jgi:hypothetical protein